LDGGDAVGLLVVAATRRMRRSRRELQLSEVWLTGAGDLASREGDVSTDD
jgi:hypothetical protein